MSTIKSSAEHLTLNADGANNDVIIQSNASTKVTVNGATGNVGIGDTSPYESLRVAGTIKIAPANQTGTLAFGGTANADVHIGVFRGAANSLSAGNSLNLAGYDNITFSASSAVVGSQTERMRVTANGLTFNGDTAAANALDDYEEGTWTPSFLNVTAPTFQTQVGWYTKIGNRVMFGGALGTTNLDNNDSSSINITGLPFNISASNGEYCVTNTFIEKGLASGNDQPTIFGIVDQPYLLVYKYTSGTGQNTSLLAYNNCAADIKLRFQGQYMI